MTKAWLRRLAAALAIAGIAGTSANARAPFTRAPIRFIVGAQAGGAIDPYARLMAEQMSKLLGRTIIVENKPGVNGNLSAQLATTGGKQGDD